MQQTQHPQNSSCQAIFVDLERARLKLEMAKASAYSRLMNRRNIESPWYGIWNETLTNLVDDHSQLLVIYTVLH
jgi:hypothetical protein